MASSLIVEVCKIRDVKNHPKADRLDLAIVKGWQVVVGRDQFKEGDLVVYVPMDAVIPTELADKWNVRNYLGGQDNDRVKCARLRGEMSYGLIMPKEYDWVEGEDVSNYYGITKYVAPVRATAADAAPRDILFPAFTDVENINNFPDSFVEGEEVVVLEKIDGTNDRVGFEMSVIRNGESVTYEVHLKAGSMSYKRTMPALWDLASNPYWFPWTLDPVVKMLKYYSEVVKKEFEDSLLETRNITLFGEVYGGSIRGGHKSMDYGTPNNYGFAVFGLMVDDMFMDWDKVEGLCGRFKVPTVPVIARTTFNMESLRSMATGNSILAQQNGKEQIREGIVIYPVKERRDPKVGRCILKMLNPDYLILKGSREAKGEVVDFKDE
jgi:RNA ligase (TIGR02306 family)